MPSVIIVFAKAPLPGRVKTRLVPALTPEQAAALHTAFVSDTLENAAACGEVELHTDVPADAAWVDCGLPRALQSAGGLGVRMFHALSCALGRGCTQAMIVGSDSPTLPAGHIRFLLESPADVALGPSEDGGYYAIACRRLSPKMFDGVEWSGPCALARTVAAAERCGLSVAIGKPWYDVDEPRDLDRLAAEERLPRHTAAALERLRT